MVSHEIALNRVQADANTIYKLALLRGIKRYSPHLENMEENLGWFKYLLRRAGMYLMARSRGENQIFPAINNVMEHSLLVSFFTLILSKYEQTDVGEAVVMAILHDVTEALTGYDVTPHGKPYVKIDENGAWKALVEGSAFTDFACSYQEYETRKSLQSRIVKSADILAAVVEMKIAESQGHQYPAFRDKYLDGAEILRQRLKELRVKGTVELFGCLQKTSPFDWMKESENSFSNGQYGKGTEEK